MQKKIISIIGAVVLTLCLVVGGVIVTGIQTAASGTKMTLSVDSPVVERDEEIKVCVKASSGEAMSYIKAKLTYDAQMLELVDSSSDKISGINGEIHIYETLAYGEHERIYELTFRALEIGNSSVTVEEGEIELYESLDLIEVSETTLTIDSVVNSALSTDARIKKMAVIGIQNIDTFFESDVYEYNLEVGVDTEMFIYSATPMNSDSVIAAPEVLTLDIGENYFEIRVTAPSGDEQIYVFHITRLDHVLDVEEETSVETETEEETVLETEAETEIETEVEMEIETEETMDVLESETLETELLDAQAIEVVE